jgi:hypothetical protein
MEEAPNTQIRYIARVYNPRLSASRTLWGVYDTVRYSWPVQIPGVPRKIKQDMRTQAEAEEEAMWLNAQKNHGL